MDICPICGSPSENKDEVGPRKIICNCYRCGKFKILETGMNVLNGYLPDIKLDDLLKIYISGWIRENQGSDIIIDEKRLESLMTLPELSMFEKADKILQYLAKKFPVAGLTISYRFDDIYGIFDKINTNKFPKDALKNSKELYRSTRDILPLFAIGRIINIEEFEFIWNKYLIQEKGFISRTKYLVSRISSAGWAYLETFRHPNPESKKAFVAMWFDGEMKDVLLKYIKPAAFDAGEYKAETIDEKDFNGNINDAIIGEIRSSKFVIADFTGNRGGVYYEAGFADGLNIPVIYSCKKEWFNKFVKQNIKIKDSKGNEKEINKNVYSQIHFDVNHQKFIEWENGDDLYKKLLNRIKATIV